MLYELRDRLLLTKLHRDEKYAFTFSLAVGIIIVLLATNLIYINLYLLKKQPPKSPEGKNTQFSNASISPSITQPTPCVNCLNPSPTGASAPLSAAQNLVKDYFIPLGSGTNQTSDWADVPGIQATVDLGKYQNINEIHFEASVYVPTANEWVSVRLYNMTDKHPVWYSEVTMNGNASAYLISPSIIYDAGPKTYQVQMKTQLQAPANLVQSRIHISLK